jgi:chromosome segregation ATPase
MVTQTSNAALSSQLSIVKASPGGKDAELKAAHTKYMNAERRLMSFQNQLATAEETNAHLAEKYLTAEQKWEARVKEYESRMKAGDERIRRERQGAKERLNELETHVKWGSYRCCFNYLLTRPQILAETG